MRLFKTTFNNFLLVDQNTKDYTPAKRSVCSFKRTFPTDDILFRSEIISKKIREIAKFILKFLGSNMFGWSATKKFQSISWHTNTVHHV